MAPISVSLLTTAMIPCGLQMAGIVFKYGREIHVVGSDGTNPRFLTNGYRPKWSPDGRHIAFGSSSYSGGEIYVVGSNGSNLRNLTNHSASDGHHSWSPDGRHIVFRSTRASTFDRGEIYVMDSNGDNRRRLTDRPSAIDEFPSWSPDGRRIAFRSISNDGYAIYVIELR